MTDFPSPTPVRRPSRGPKLLLWIALSLVALIGVAWATLAIVFPPPKVRGIVQQQLGAMLAREVRFDDARIGLWPPVRVSVKGLALAEPGGFARGTAVQVGSLDLDLDAFGLLSRSIVIRHLELVEPVAHIVLRTDGTTNLDNLTTPPAKQAQAKPMDLAVSRFEVKRGRLLIDDIAARRRISFGLDTRTSFALGNAGARINTNGTSRVTDLAYGPLSAAKPADLNRSLAKLEWALEHRGAFDLPTKRLAFERLALHLDRTELALTGTIDASRGAPNLDLRARGTAVDLGQVLSHLSAADAKALKGIHGDGQLDFDLAVRGAMSAKLRPAIVGTFSVRKGAFKYPGAPVGVEDASFDARIGSDSLSIPNLLARVSGQELRGELAMVRFADPLVHFGVRGDLDLAAVSQVVAPKDTKLSGRVALDVRGSGRAKDPANLALDGIAKLSKVGVVSPQIPKPLENVEGELAFSQARAHVKGLIAHAGESSFRLDADVTRPLAMMATRKPDGSYGTAPSNVQFTLQSKYLDLAELLPATPGGPMLANATGGGHVSIARLKNKRLDVQNVNAEVALQPAIVDVQKFSLLGYGGSVTGQARIDSRDVANPAMVVKAVIDSARADALLGAWTKAGNLLHGSISTNLDLSTRGATPNQILASLTAQGLAGLANGTLGPAPALAEIANVTRIAAFREITFKNFNLPFRVENGRVATGPAKLIGSLGEWQLNGTTGFDGSLDYGVSITLPPEVVSRLGSTGALAAGALADEAGRVLIDLRVTGTAKEPRVKLDERSTRDRLVNRVTRAIGGSVTKLLEPPTRDPSPAGNTDSARAAQKQARLAYEDSLKKQARKLFDGIFGGKRDTSKH